MKGLTVTCNISSSNHRWRRCDDKINKASRLIKYRQRFDVYIKGNRNDFFATRGADIAILTGFGMDLLVINY
jgi:hypothetical protein